MTRIATVAIIIAISCFAGSVNASISRSFVGSVQWFAPPVGQGDIIVDLISPGGIPLRFYMDVDTAIGAVNLLLLRRAERDELVITVHYQLVNDRRVITRIALPPAS